MQVGKLFALVADAQDIYDFFDGVETREQLVSRLELLKRQDTEDLLACLLALPSSLNNLLTDTLELSPSLDDGGEDESLDKELEELAADLQSVGDDPDKPVPPPSENQNTNSAAQPQGSETEKTVSSPE